MRPKIWRLRSIWCARLRRRASCRFRIFPLGESPLLPTPRWCAIWALNRSSWDRAFFKSSDPEKRARAIVKAATHYQDPKAVLEASEELGEAMKGLDVRQIDPKDLLQTRGW